MGDVKEYTKRKLTVIENIHIYSLTYFKIFIQETSELSKYVYKPVIVHKSFS